MGRTGQMQTEELHGKVALELHGVVPCWGWRWTQAGLATTNQIPGWANDQLMQSYYRERLYYEMVFGRVHWTWRGINMQLPFHGCCGVQSLLEMIGNVYCLNVFFLKFKN